MSQLLATVAFVLGVAGLYWLDRNRDLRWSPALLIPTAWLAIGGSRVLSSWLDPTPDVSAAEAYLEGNPLDRNFQTALLVMGLLVLLRNRQQVGRIIRANLPILLFFVYCGLSAHWSEFPNVSIRRWIKSLGDVVMVMVVLVDRDPHAALKLPARVGFLLIPASVLLMKYFPELARSFNPITGDPEYTGVATSKNSLGLVCMLFGLGSVARFIQAWNDQSAGRSGRLIAHGVVIVLALWLFLWAHSMTSMACFALGVCVVVALSFPSVARNTQLVHALVLTPVFMCFCILFLGVGDSLLEGLGRDTSLTGRTAIWERVLAMVERPVFGTGYESFWLGERLEHMLSIYRGINQSHNGYIEVFVNLGWVGVGVLAVLVVAAYRNANAGFHTDSEWGKLRLAYFMIGLVINFTEASFKMMSPVWVIFLLAAFAVPLAGNKASAGAAQLTSTVSSRRRGRLMSPATGMAHRTVRTRARM